MPRYVITKITTIPRRYWTGPGKKWSIDLEDARIIHSKKRGNEIIAELPTGKAGKGVVYSIEELIE